MNEEEKMIDNQNTVLGYSPDQYIQNERLAGYDWDYNNYGVLEWHKDAFTTFMVNMNLAQYSADMGKFILAEDEINDLDGAENYINAVSQGQDWSTFDPTLIDKYTRTLKELGINDSLDNATKLRLIDERRKELTEEQKEHIKNANEDLQDIQDWQSKWEVTDYYKAKEAQPADYTIDSLLYKLPGVFGSSAQAVGWQALSIGAAIAGTVGSILLAPVTGGSSVVAWSLMASSALAGLGVGIMSGIEENSAEVYDNYKSAVTQKLQSEDQYRKLIEESKDKISSNLELGYTPLPGIKSKEDVKNLTDDQVMDAILGGGVDVSNVSLEKAADEYLPATKELFYRDMATTVGTEVFTTALQVIPIGQFSKASRAGKYLIGKYNAAKESVLGTALAKKIDQVAHFGLSNTAKNAIKRRNVEFVASITKRNMMAGLAEGPGEEGVQYLNGQAFIQGKYGADIPSWAEMYAESMADKAKSIWAFMSPFDAAEKYDDEWLENSRSGLLMGMFNFPQVIANTRDILQNVRTNRAMSAIKQGLDAQVFEDKEAWNHALFYAKNAGKLNKGIVGKLTSGETAIQQAFDAFSNFMPEEFTPEMWQHERNTFSNIRNLAKSKTVVDMAELRGIEPNTKEFDYYLALLEYKAQKRNEARKNLVDVETQVNKELEEIKKRAGVSENIFKAADQVAQFKAVDRLLQIYEDQEEMTRRSGIKMNKRDVNRARSVLKDIKKLLDEDLRQRLKERPFPMPVMDAEGNIVAIASITTPEQYYKLELPQVQEDLVQQQLFKLDALIYNRVSSEDYTALWTNSSKENKLEYTDEQGVEHTRVMSEKEVEDNINYSKEIVKRFMDVDNHNAQLQQELRDTTRNDSTQEQPINVTEEVTSSDQQEETTPTPVEEPTSVEQPIPVEPSAEPAEEPVPVPVGTPEPEQKPTSKPEEKPSNEPPSTPEETRIPEVGEEGSLSAPESDSKPPQEPQTPSPEQSPTPENEAPTDPENASTEGSSVEPSLKPEQNPESTGSEQPKLSNRYVSEDAYQAARERIRRRLGNLNSGFDPSVLPDLITIGAYHLENGARKFVAFAKKVMEDLGSAVKPYLQSAYEGARTLPDNPYRNDMDSSEEVNRLVANNFEELDKALDPQQEQKPKPLSSEQVSKLKDSVKQASDRIDSISNNADILEKVGDRLLGELKQLQNELNSIDLIGDIYADKEQSVNDLINRINDKIEVINSEYQKALKAQQEVKRTQSVRSQNGFFLWVEDASQQAALELMNMRDLFDKASFEVLVEDGKPILVVSHRGKTARFKILDNRRDQVNNYPQLLNSIKEWIELVRKNPNKYEIVPIGFNRTVGDLIKLQPGQIIPMTNVLFWNEVMEAQGVTDPSDPYQIDDTNFVIGVVDTEANIRNNGMIVGTRRTRDKGWGDVIWMAKIPRSEVNGGYVTVPIMLNPMRLSGIKGAAECIVDALIQYISNPNSNTPFTKDGKESPFTAEQVLNLLTYFNNHPTNEQRLSAKENYARQLKTIEYDQANGILRVGDKQFKADDFLKSKEMLQQIIEILNSPAYGFHFPIVEETLSNCWGAHETNPFNPLAPLKNYFINHSNQKSYTLLEGLTFDREMVGLGKHKKGINWLGFLVKNNLLHSGAMALSPRMYVTGFELIEAEGNTDEQTTKTMDEAIQNEDHEQSSNDEDNPFADAFGDIKLNYASRNIPYRKRTDELLDKARKIVISLTDLTEDQVEIVDDILGITDAGLYIMAQSRLDSIVLSDYNIPGIEYHEAWHRISNLLMKPALRNKIFAQVRKKYGKNLTDTEVDDILAERFREFQLESAEVIDFTTTNLFKKVWNFIKVWAKIGNLRLARIYYKINIGGYRKAIPSKENIERFKKLYEGKGPNFTFNGEEFKQFNNRFELNSAIDSLMYYVFYNPRSKVSFYQDADKINFDALYLMLRKSNRPAMQELADNWPAVTSALSQRLQQLSIRYSDKEESLLENEVDGGNLAKVNMDDYTKASYEIDVLGNQTADVKFFFSTVPQYAPDPQTNAFSPVLDEITGLPKFYDIRYIWNVATTELNKCNTLLELMQELDRLIPLDPMYAGIKWKLNQYIAAANSTDEKTRNDAEGAITRILTAIKKQHLVFDTVRITRNGDEGYNIDIVDNTVDMKSRILPSMWSNILLQMTDSFEVDKEGKITLLEQGYENLNNFIKSYEKLQEAFLKNNGVLKQGDLEFDLRLPANQERAKRYIVNMLATVGIQVEVGTINQLLKNQKYNVDAYTKLYNLVVRRDINYGGFPRLVETIKSILNSNDLNNVVVDGKAVDISRIYDSSGFVSQLAQADVQFHSNHDNLMNVGAGNNLIYTKSDNNFISDRTSQLNANDEVVEGLLNHSWNKYEIQTEDGETITVGTSLILNHIQNGGTISLEVFLNFKTDNYGDKGSDYHGINELEDYIAKLTLLINERVIFPTLEAKKTYYVINGVKLPYGGVIGATTSTDLGTIFQFSNQLLDLYIRYLWSDYNAVMTTIDQLTEGSPNYISETERITNYHTDNFYVDEDGKKHKVDPNGTRFRLLLGLYTYETDSKGNKHLKYTDLVDPKKSSKELAELAKKMFFDQPIELLRALVNLILNQRLKQEINYCQSIGLIEGNLDDYTKITSKNFDVRLMNIRAQKYSKHQHAMAIIDIIADGMNRGIMSTVETNKCFIGDPAFFKWFYDKDSIKDNSIDEIKRHGGLGSTGMNNRIDLEDFNPFYRVAELKDYKQGSDQLAYLLGITANGYLREFVKKEHGEQAISGVSTEELRLKYPELRRAADIAAKRDFGGYAKGINVADAAAYVTPEFYARLMRSVGEWSDDLKKAYAILMDDNSDWYSQQDAYHTVIKASLRVLKYVAYGTRFEHGNAVPYFNKMALFPLFKNIATGDMQHLYERMTREDGIDMVMFESAVKVGSKHPTSTSDLENLVVYNQDIQYLRQQLNTKGHTEPHINTGTQMLKVALGNLDLNCDYNGLSGKQIRDNIMQCLNNLSDRGVKRLFSEFYDKNGEFDIKKFSEIMLRYFRNNPNNDNFIEGTKYEGDNLVLPLSALSDVSFLESVLLSMVNLETIDVSFPGGAFIQRSAFGIEATENTVVSDEALNDGYKLKMIDEKDGSMHAIISVTMFRDVIPDFDNKTFDELRQWLIDHNIIGENSEPIGIGYRIPTQAQASISALKFVDVLPAVLEDTIILPEEFTKLTGSDFDIDKLFVIRYGFNEKGKKYKYNDNKSVEDNSERAVKNRMIEQYIKVLTSKDYQQQMKISIDNATEMLHDVLDRIERNRIQDRPTPFSSQMLSYQCAKKAEYTIGKAGIGPYALNNAHHVLTQLTEFKMADTMFNRVFQTDRLDKQYDNDGSGRRVLDWLSGLINAFVDIAKDPFIIRLNVNAFTYNITAYLIRMGYGESTFMFLNQPILIDLAREILNVRGNFGKPRNANQFTLELDVTDRVLRKYGFNLEDIRNEARDMLEMDDAKSGILTKFRDEAFNLFEKVIDGKATEKEKTEANRRAIVLFYAFSNPAQSVSDLVKYSKIDTKKHGKSIAEWDMYQRGMMLLIEDTNFGIGLVERFYKDTFIFIKTRNTISSSSIFARELFRANVVFKNRLDNILRVLGKNTKLNTESLNRIVASMESSIKAHYINEMFLSTGRYTDLYDLFYGDNSIPKRLLKLKSDIKRGLYPDLLNPDGSIANEFLNFIFPNIIKNDPIINRPDTIETRLSTNPDINRQNEIIYSWDELLHHPNEEINALAKDLIFYAFYTSGDQTSPNSFFKYVPYTWKVVSGYGWYIDRLLSQEQDADLSMIFDDEIFLNNWLDETLVPTVPYAQSMLVPNPAGVSWETVSRQGIPATKTIPGTDIHPQLLFVGDMDRDSDLYIRPNAYVRISEETVLAIHPPFVKMKYSPSYNINGTIVYKLIGYRAYKTRSGRTRYVPVYSMVSKRGYNHKGNRIVEYGISAHFDFNEFVDNVDAPIGPKDIFTNTFLKALRNSNLPDQLQEQLFKDLANFISISEYYQMISASDYSSSDLYESFYEQQEDEGGSTQTPAKPKPAPVQQPIKGKGKIPLEEFAKMWTEVEGYAVDWFYKFVLPRINEAWNMRYMYITDTSVQPTARIKAHNIAEIPEIKMGERTSFTILESEVELPFYLSLKSGDVVQFYDDNGESILCVVTRPMRKLTDYIQSTVPDSVEDNHKQISDTLGGSTGEEGSARAESEIKDAVKKYKEGLTMELVLEGVEPVFTEEEIQQIKSGLKGSNLRVMSVSRFTDPAFYAKEIIEALKRNAQKPFTDPSRFNAIELWTKHDGEPIQKILQACKLYKIAPMVSFSITGLGDTALEKGVLKYDTLIDMILKLIESGELNPATTTIRLDPILVGYTNMDDIKNIVRRCKALGLKKYVTSLVQSYGYLEGTNRDRSVVSGINKALAEQNQKYDWDKYYGFITREDAMISDRFTSEYTRTHPRASYLEKLSVGFANRIRVVSWDSIGKVHFTPKFEYIDQIGEILLQIQKENPDIILETCSFTIPGLKASACLDPLIIERLVGVDVTRKDGTYDRDTSRPDCMCYGAHQDMYRMNEKKCFSSCAYCYAAQSGTNNTTYYDNDGNLIDRPLTRISGLFIGQPQNRLNTINVYAGTGENSYLSNFAIRPFTIVDGTYQSVEQAFQALKYWYTNRDFKAEEILNKIKNTTNGAELRKLGRQFDIDVLRWDSASERILKNLMFDSFNLNPEAKQKLLSTGNAIITHVQARDKYKELFPRLLMEVREELRNLSSSKSDTDFIQQAANRLVLLLNEMGYTQEQINSLVYQFVKQNDNNIDSQDKLENEIRKFICNL